MLERLARSGIGLVQLPCPETLYLGMERLPMTRQQYDTPEYRQLCGALAGQWASFLQQLGQRETRVVGLMGIEKSPSCDAVCQPGVFMDILLGVLGDGSLPRIDIPEDVTDAQAPSWGPFLEELDRWLSALDSADEIE